jgi:hypothetical protein
MCDNNKIESLKVHNFRNGDVLIAKVRDSAQFISEKEADDIKKAIKSQLPGGVGLIFSNGIDYELLRHEPVSVGDGVTGD